MRATVMCAGGDVRVQEGPDAAIVEPTDAILRVTRACICGSDSVGIARPGGAVGRVGVPQHTEIPGSLPAFFGNITIGGGPAPVRAYFDEQVPDVLEGRIDPGRVFDRTVGLDGVPDGYHAMADRESIKVMVTP